MSEASLRLYLDQPLAPGQSVALSQAHAHYLSAVMRQVAGAEFLGFNGRDGEWLLRLIEITRRGGLAVVERLTREQVQPRDLWLLFAPIKKARTDFIVEKAVEMGAARILPVATAHTNSERIRQDRLQAHAREAAEQCGATFVPPVAELSRLDRLLATWPEDRRLAFCDEAAPPGPAFADATPGAWALLIGPEGGFSEAERTQLLAKPFVTQIRLGPRILRADTAAVAALALWQNAIGDWT